MFKKLFGGLLGSSETPSAPNFEQRRKTARRASDIAIEASLGRSSFPVTVVDMGIGGLRLHNQSPRKLKNKAVLKLTYPEPIPKHDTLTIDAVIRWTKVRHSDSSQFIGVEFKDQKSMGKSWVKAKMGDLGFRPYNIREQRKNYRVGAKLPASLDIGAGAVNCAIKNIGLGGFLVNLRKPIRAGATISLKIGDNPSLPSTTYTATVRHQQHPDPGSPFGYGCAFTELSAEQEDALRSFLIEQSEAQWEKAAEWSDYLLETYTSEEDNEDVEIPDLESILAEEPDEQEEAEEPEPEE